jgi:Leucine-rich repeat (LRR) protein
MPKDQAYLEAEKKIRQVQNSESIALDLAFMNIDEIPKALESFTSLQFLNLSGNQLSNLPAWLSKLTTLEYLNLSGNQIKNLPNWLSSLTKLRTLNISFNPLIGFLNSLDGFEKLIIRLVGYRKNLKINDNECLTVYLSEDQKSVLINEKSRLPTLQSLSLFDIELAILPNWVGQLSQLRTLNLSNNHISSLPEWISNLNQLQTIDLSNNELVALPDTFFKTSQLLLLNLKVNNIIALPEKFGNLTQLQSLNLQSNRITTLPESFGNLAQLRSLNLQSNRITALPETLGKLSQLQSLNLNENNLIKLPDSLGKLSKLEILEIKNISGTRDNSIRDLPISFAQLENLKKLLLDGNPLNPELAQAYEEGLDAVKSYLRAKSEAQLILTEAKLILVGEGEVGKTCLMDALLDKPWQEHPSTHGIEIQSFKVTDRHSQSEITINGWDFGGQRVYRPTHQLFFSAPAVYLIVWKPREGPQQGFVKEWIQLVKRREPSAKIIVVATHGGPKQRQPDIDRQDLWDLFGKDTIVDFFFVDSKPNENGKRKGIEELKVAIARVAAELPEVGRSVPKSFADVRTALQEKGLPYLPLDEVLAICRTHDMDDEIARLFITISHRLGHLTHYENDPTLRDIVILRPDWLASAMSYVLDDEATRKANGLVKFSRLSQLWNDPTRPADTRYDESLHRIFLRLMERFDLSYRVAGLSKNDDSDPISLIAQLVPNATPFDEDLINVWSQEPVPNLVQQTQICRIVDEKGQSANAEGLFYQLIVRLHRYSLGRVNYNDSVHWQRGLILDAEYNGRAFLKHINNDVYITVRAIDPKGLLTLLTEDIRFLVESFWEGLRCEITVPCLNPTPCYGLLEVQKLIESKEKNRSEHPCPICNEWQNIDTLLQNATAATKPVSEDKLYAELVKVKDEVYKILPKLNRQQEVVLNRFADVSTNLQKILSQAENNLNIIMQALADEAKEGPRLFTLVPIERDRFDPRNWVTTRFRLTLWCEHSRLPLTVLNKDKTIGVYEFDLNRKWLKDYSPLIKAFTITLKSLLPVAFSAAKLAIDAAIYKEIENELDFSKACIDALISEGEGINSLFIEGAIGNESISLPQEKLITEQNANLREFHSLLNKLDPTRKYGNLLKVTNKQQKFMWVHENYRNNY